MIKILVEGLGEELSLDVLFRKMNISIEYECINMGGKSNIIREKDGFEMTILRQVELGYNDFIVLLDWDSRFYPYHTFGEEQNGLQTRSNTLITKNKIRINLFWAVREYESWLIGGLNKGDQYCELEKPIKDAISGDTQAFPDDPKEWLIERIINNRYDTQSQVCFTRHFNIKLAKKRNKSFEIFLDHLNNL